MGFEVRGFILRVLDAFRPRGATWLGQVISSPPDPSGGPSKTHLLPGGGIPRVHRARRPVPPRLPLFATPRSVRQFAAVGAGTYPPRCPPNAWWPGVPALPGPCYWLVASGTPVGWRGGCLALGLVRGAMHHYCLGRCSALVVYVRRSRPVRGGWCRCRVLSLPCFPLPAPRLLRYVWRAVPSGCPLSSLAGTPFHAVCAFRGSVRLPFWLSPRVLCVCARALAASAPPPPPRVGVARAPRAVPVLGAGRAVPLGPCPSVCPASVPRSVWLAWGGGQPGPASPYLAWGCALPVGWVRAWGPVTNPTARALASWPCALAWPTQGAPDRTAELLAKLLSGSEAPDVTALSEAVKAKLGITQPLPKPALLSPSPGWSTLADDLKRSRVSRLLPKVTCPSPFHPRARTVPIAELQDVPVTETEKTGLSALAPLAGVSSSPSGLTPRGGKMGRPIAQANIQLELPEFDPKNLPEWAEEFAEFLLLTGQSHVDVATKCSLLKRSCKKKFLQKQVKQIVKTCSTWAEVLQRLEKTFPV